MTIEISTDLEWRYQLNPKDLREIQYRRNRPNQRWRTLMRLENEQEARKGLLTIQSTQEDDSDE